MSSTIFNAKNTEEYRKLAQHIIASTEELDVALYPAGLFIAIHVNDNFSETAENELASIKKFINDGNVVATINEITDYSIDDADNYSPATIHDLAPLIAAETREKHILEGKLEVYRQKAEELEKDVERSRSAIVHISDDRDRLKTSIDAVVTLLKAL